MLIIEIQQLENGGHRNMTGGHVVPQGWAIVPEDLEIPDSFPFVDIEVEGNIVISMTGREVPEPEPEPDVPTPSGDSTDEVWDAIAQAITEGVNEVD